jgi:hypothetical protein
VSDEHDCLLIPPANGDMSLSICRLLNDRLWSRDWGRAARQTVETGSA